MAEEPLIPPLDTERPIRTDVILDEDEVFADAPDEEVEITQALDIEVEPEVDEEGISSKDFRYVSFR